jgi:hypothetical protein
LRTCSARTALTLVGPESSDDSSWAEVSWEKMSDYPADVLLVHDASADYEDNPVYKSLPAVKAGQLGTWDDKRAYTYDGYAEWLGELADVIDGREGDRRRSEPLTRSGYDRSMSAIFPPDLADDETSSDRWPTACPDHVDPQYPPPRRPCPNSSDMMD